MYSKEWKLVAALAASVLMLSACGRNDDEEASESSNAYTGVWVSEEAILAYRTFEAQNKDPKAFNINGFCEEINANPLTHGLSHTWSGKVQLDAWMVRPNGEIFRYSPFVKSDASDYRTRYFRGSVDGAGIYTIASGINTRSYVYPSCDYSTGLFERQNLLLAKEGDKLFVQTASNEFGFSTTLVRATDSEIRVYGLKVKQCASRLYSTFGASWGVNPDARWYEAFPERYNKAVQPVTPSRRAVKPAAGGVIVPPASYEVPQGEYVAPEGDSFQQGVK